MKVKDLILELQKVDGECEIFTQNEFTLGYYISSCWNVRQNDFVYIDDAYDYDTIESIKRKIDTLENEHEEFNMDYWEDRCKILKEALKQTPIKGIVLWK